jgi:hypothetical protein
MASRYHCGRGRNDTNDRVVAQVKGIGLVLQILKILEGGHGACLCFWAAETSVAALNLGVGTGRLAFTTYLPPHMVATAIQRTYHSHLVDKSIDNQVWQISLEDAKFELERDMFCARRDLRHKIDFVFLVSSFFWSVIWMSHLDNG